jgi:hypothetical protein
MIKKFVIYLFRWQLSTPILVPVIMYSCAYLASNPYLDLGESLNYWIAVIVANFVGAFIFFWIDKFIFKTQYAYPLWEIKDESVCADCGKMGRCYRLVKANNYDRFNDEKPVYRCEHCSQEKLKQLVSQGIKIS